MRTEYEVYSPAFDAYIDPIVCLDKEKADAIAEKLRGISGAKFGSSCDWQVREIIDRKGPIPAKAGVVTPLRVDEVRKLMAKHGQDCIVVIAWNANESNVNIATAGSDSIYSQMAYATGKKIAAATGCDTQELEKHEDRRDEHKS